MAACPLFESTTRQVPPEVGGHLLPILVDKALPFHGQQ